MHAFKLNAVIVAILCVTPGCSCTKETVKEPASTTVVHDKDPAPATTTVVEQPAPASTTTVVK